MEKGEKILQIFESSACLKADQMLGYLRGSLFQEELRVVELHLASCNFCQEALEGLESCEDAKAFIDNLSIPTLPLMEKSVGHTTESTPLSKTIFPPSTKKSHITPSLPKSTFTTKNHTSISRQRNLSWLGISGIAALLLLGGILFWQYENSNLDWKSFSIASNDAKAPVVIDSPPHPNKDTTPKVAPNQGHSIAQRPIIHPAVNVADSGKKIVAEVVSGTNQKTNGMADSGKTANALLAATSTVKSASNDVDASANHRATNNKDSQSDAHPQTATLAAASTQKVQSKPITKAATKPTEPAGIGTSDFQTGKSLFLKKQYASALLYLRTASESDSDPHHIEAMYYSALCNLQIGKTGRAKRLFKKVEKSDSPLSAKASAQLEQL